MKTIWLYRIAAALFLLFAAGHTLGFLTFTPPDAQAQAVREAMNQVHFQVGGATLSYGGFYVGFGLYITLYMIFSAFLAWQLSLLARRAPQAIAGLGWIFFLVQAGGVVLSLIYLSGPPVVFSIALAICLGCATLALPKDYSARNSTAAE